MKFSLLSILLLLQFFNVNAQKWIVESNSKIDIEVPSTITTTQCGLDAYNSNDTLEIETQENYSILTGMLHIAVNLINCHQSLVTKEMMQTMKVESFPYLNIKLFPSSRFLLNTHTTQSVTGNVAMEMAGVTKQSNWNYSITPMSYSNIELSGSQKIRLSEYGLKVPSKLGGLIKVYDEVNVTFHLFLKRID